MNYFRSSAKGIICLLCKHYCELKEGKSGICGINFNRGGELVNITYAHPSTINLDPIEKKPLYHFLPSTSSLSLGTVGCNLRCPFCQNYTISQTSSVDESITVSPQEVVDLALKHGAKSISYTYNEPAIWYQYARDIGMLAKEAGLANIFVSSGYESSEVLADMPSWVNAANIDLKSFSHDYYKKTLKAGLDGVLETLKTVAKSSIHLEVTTLIIEGVNDGEIEQMARFIATELGCDVPWHLSAFYPNYKMLGTTPTTPSTLFEAKQIAKNAGLEYVYIGNIANDSSSYCPKCSAKLVDRSAYNAKIVGLKNGRCKACNYAIKGVWGD
ncbi:MAG: AmmeMemoRadiSam system radical SAM enzyme [Sulfuricurvum sp.]